MGVVETDVSISEIPFPTVTICPQAKYSKKRFDLSCAFVRFPDISDAEQVLGRCKYFFRVQYKGTRSN